ncbi:MAG: hypothetical protein OT477_14115 [Chloroflexi bacterium]|nr:hypothetical protein [Chloroflexota bacterium]
MNTATIPIPLDWQTARAYHAIPPASQENLHQLIALLLREFATSTPQSLLRLMDAMSREAAENGLDEATLIQLLQDE